MGRAARPGLGPHARPRGARLARAGARPRRRAGRGQPARRRFARSSSGGRDQRGAWEPVAALLRVLGGTVAGGGRALAVAVAFARKARLLANRSFFKYKWNSGMPPGPATA